MNYGAIGSEIRRTDLSELNSEVADDPGRLENREIK